MSEDEKCDSVTESSSESLSTGEMPKQTGKEVQVEYNRAPPAPPPEHKIHPRQNIPSVPEGDAVPDKNPSPPVDLD